MQTLCAIKGVTRVTGKMKDALNIAALVSFSLPVIHHKQHKQCMLK
jgi:hypothetical protein